LVLPLNVFLSDSYIAPIRNLRSLEVFQLRHSAHRVLNSSFSVEFEAAVENLKTNPLVRKKEEKEVEEEKVEKMEKGKEKEKESDLPVEQGETNLFTRRGIVTAFSPLQSLRELSLTECAYRINCDEIGKYLSPSLVRISIDSPLEESSRVLGSRRLHALLATFFVLFLLFLSISLFYLVATSPPSASFPGKSRPKV